MKLYRRYRTSPEFRFLVDRALELHAQNNKADPFAYGRKRLHLLAGLDEPELVIKEETAREKHV